MNLLRAILLFFAAVGVAGAAETPLEFSGVLTDGEKTRFAFTDKANQQTTWVELGAEINGYTVARYEPKEETVTLQRGLEELPLRLIVAKSSDAPAETGALGAILPGPAADEKVAAIRNNLRQLVVAARQHQLNTGAVTATYADLVGPDKPIKELQPVDGENYAALTFGPDASNLSVTTASGITVTVDTAPALGALADAARAQAEPPVVAMPAAPTPAAAQPPAPTDTTTTVPSPTGPTITNHLVREGDTLAKIAEAAGVPEQQILALNPDLNPSSLRVGQPIRIR